MDVYSNINSQLHLLFDHFLGPNLFNSCDKTIDYFINSLKNL